MAVGIAFALLQLAVFAVAQWPFPAMSTVLMHVFAFLDFGSAWAVVGIVGGGMMPRLRGSIVAGALTLLAMVCSYCGVAWLSTPGMRSSAFPVVFWSSAALLGGPVLGAVGALGRRRDAWSLVAWIGGPLLVVIETGRQMVVGDEPGYVPLHIAAWMLVAVGAGISVRRVRATARVASP